MNAQKTRLYKDVEFLSGIRPFRNHLNIASLNIAANYIKNEFAKVGLICEEQKWLANGRQYKNIIASWNPEKQKRLIVGAHYDAAGDQPGADDNASGIAGLLESARLVAANKPDLDYRIDFVAYCLEEPPYFGGNEMGSYIHAKSLKDSQAEVLGMICYEMIGYFSEEEDSQPNPIPELAHDFPSVGNFIVAVGINKHEKFNNQIHLLMSENEGIETRVLSLPENNTLVGLSDQRNYWKFGYKAVMITDTAVVRNQWNYHKPSDTIDTLNFDKMTEVINSTYNALVNIPVE